jgi:AraC family transcriptional regulator of adaptative response / DNA-3-methyladenine glycosylase II
MIIRMDTLYSAKDFDTCYLALKAHDARFDGCFFTGVRSTGIYCRPVCRVRTPKRENCRFFQLAAQAEQAGFRPCLRCRPELAPRQFLHGVTHTPAWSMQDASSILALQAAARMDAPSGPNTHPLTIENLADKLGISGRHLRRIFESQFGISPLQYLQTRRLLTAKQLLTDTPLAISRVADMSGFASVRSFNAAFVKHYNMNPTQLRRTGGASGALAKHNGIQVRLAYRPPYDIDALLRYLGERQMTGVDVITPEQNTFAKTMTLQQGKQLFTGWVFARFNEINFRVDLQVSEGLSQVLPEVITRVRDLLDLDADPQAINPALHGAFPEGDGLRVPGTLDGFELAVRAVLGQQITVAAARTLANRLVTRFGEPIETPLTGLNRLFPTAKVLASASGDELGSLGIVKTRQAAIQALANAVVQGDLRLDAGADVSTTLQQMQAMPGIGDWTAQYIAMRALRWPDAFPAGDVALHKALAVTGQPKPAQAALAASRAWQPWRAYAVVRAWARLHRTSMSHPKPKMLLTQ